MHEDKQLISGLKHGDPEALRRIYEKYRLYLLKIASALSHDVSIAEDIVHDVFMRFAQSTPTLRINGSLKAYLRTCVVNGIRNKIRYNKVRPHVELSQVGPTDSGRDGPDQWVILKEETARINHALIQVPFEQREVVVLHLIGGMTFREIAGLQAVSAKTAHSRYHYGINKLRSILNHEVKP